MKQWNGVALLFLMLTFFSCGPTEELTLSEGEIYNDFHRSNIGKITFMGDVVPYENYSEKDFLTSFDLMENVNLNIRTYLGKTLTWSLHELAPDLSVNELCDKGNFQFAFYVDGQLIYTENLNTGAGSCSGRNSNTVFRVPLLSVEEEDSWGRFMWMRFMYREGGEDALSEGSHLLKIEIRPYIELEELKVGDVLAQGEITINVVKEKVEEKDIAIQKIAPRSGWDLSEEKINAPLIRELNTKIAQRAFKDISSIVVVKNGQLLLEEYFNGSDRSTLHNPRSVGKTFASTMTGIAIEEGHLQGVDQTLSEFYKLKSFKNYSPKKEEVTLKQLLTMNSSFNGNDSDYDSPGNEENMYPTEDWVKFTLDLSMLDENVAENNWKYFTAGVVVLGDILHQKVPGGLEKYTHEKLFAPLGISSYQWQYTPQGVGNTAGGLQLRALDFARYGQCYKDGGKGPDGSQVIPADWVQTSLGQLIPLPDGEKEHYGYLFWNKSYEVNGKSYEVSYCNGNGGNKIFVFKDLPLVIVVTAQAYGQPYGHSQVDKMMKNYILPAIME